MESISAFLRCLSCPLFAGIGKPARQWLALLSAVIALSTARSAFAGGIPQTLLVYHLGPGETRLTGDYVSNPVGAGGGLGSPYIYYIEVPPGLASLQVDIFDPDVAGTNDPTAGFTETYALTSPSGTVTSRACTGTVAVTCPDNAWANLATIANPAAGHWKLTLTTSGTTTGINGYAIRAHDGTAGAGGKELNVYAESYIEPGLATGTTPVVHNFYPYVTSGCDLRANNFDFDVTDAARCSAGGADCSVALTTRSGAVLPILAGAPALSINDAWASPVVNNWTTATNAGGYGIWKESLSTIANYITQYFGAFNAAAVPPTAQPQANTFRIYLPSDAGTAPLKPYVEQSYTYTSGPNPPVVASTTRVTVTVRVVNPTPYPVTFSGTNLVTANVPGAGAVYAGGALVSQGTIMSQPAIGGIGNLTWNPGVVATNATVLLTYLVDVTPTGAGAVNITGIPTSNGTTAQYIDDTGAAQARATHAFGPLCGLTATATQGMPALTVNKSSSPSGVLDPGETVTYTVTVTNSGAATIPLANIVVTDTLPTGMTYVANSTVTTGPVMQAAPLTFLDNFASAAYNLTAGTQNWSTTSWTEANDDGTATAGTILINGGLLRVAGVVNASIRRSANLTGAVAATLTFALGNNAIDEDAGDDGMAIQVSKDGVTFTTLDTFNAGLIMARSYDITPYISATTTIRFVVTAATEATEYFTLDNVQISYITTAAGTKDNIVGGANPDLVNGIPPSLVGASDNFALAPGATLTTTFRATVNNPLAVGITQVTNTATASSGTTSKTGSVTNYIGPEVQVTGTVWLDVDGDGINDAGEPGITGVTVAIYSAGPNGVIGGGDDVLVGTVTTDANGDYGLGRLPAGNYYTDVTDTGAQLGGLTIAPGTTDPSGLLTLVAGSTGTANFGYVPTGSTTSVEGTVWGDPNGDGRHDAGEIGIGTATVRLVRAGPDGLFGTGDDVVAATTTTDADGGYLFTSVAVGEYVVRVDSASATLTGYTPTIGPDSEGGYVSSPVTIAAGDVAAGLDFGFDRATLYTLSDRIWEDADGDGVLDANEDGLAAVVVNLLDSLGRIVATVITNVNGTFSFTGIPNGNYTIAVPDNTGVLNDMNGTTAAGISSTKAVIISGLDVSATSFGYNHPGLVGGVLWSDADGDGVRDAGEVRLGGVPVELRHAGCTAGSTCLTTTTAADGSYQFTGIAAGTYTVVVTTPPAGTQTGDPDQPGAACTTCNNQGTATVPASGSDPDLDFGYRNPTVADVSGTVFNDLDGDGVQEGGEGGLAGVTVELRNATGMVVATTSTDASGNYAFPDVPAGTYRVVVTDQNALLSGYTSTSGLDQRVITVPATGTVDVDFGYGQKATTAQFSSTVWLDENNDGAQGSGEVGVSRVTVNLYRDNNLDGIPDGAAVATTTTDVNGNYVFRNLAPGTYLADAVEGTLPGAGAQLTATTFLTSPGYAQVVLSEREVRSDGADFGYKPAGTTAALSGVVWADADVDGFRDAGETGLGGVTVTILNRTTNAVVTTVNTNPDGSWTVVGLAAGSYAVMYDQTDIPGGYTATQPTNLGAGQTTYTVAVVGGDVVPNLDFGFRENPGVAGVPYGTVSGTVYRDANANSSQQAPAEAGIAGLTVNLVSGGQIVATTTTDANGNYSFTGVPPGAYTVVATDQNGVLVGLNPTQLLPATVTVVAGGTVDADAGYSSSPATLTTVGGTVWLDVNSTGGLSNNGVLNTGEPGLGGVNLELWYDTNNNGIIEPGTDNLVRTATTDSSGTYAFSNAPAGAYLVRVLDAGLGTKVPTPGGGAGVDNNSQANPYPVTLVAGGSSNFTADFGYFTTTYTISGIVFEDANNNATNNTGDTPVAGAVVSIYRIVNGVRQLVATVTTGLTGTYTSPALPPGSYEVEVNTQGTAVAGYDQTTQAGTGGVARITLSSNVSGTNFGFFNDAAVTTTPITLASFQALAGATAGTVEVKWTTATEAGNLGFVVYGRTYGGEWRKLTAKLIPSKAVDSLEPQTYAVTLSNVAWVQEVALTDVSIRGKTTQHGPFAIGEVVGEPPTVERTKWPEIRRGQDEALQQSERRVLVGKPAVGLMRAARMMVRTPGIQRVTHEQLLAAGVDLSKVPVAQIAVTDNGRAVARYIGGRPIFGTGSYIEFIGQVTPTLYSNVNVYVLTMDPTKVSPVTELPVDSGPRRTGTYEATYQAYPNQVYSFSAPTADPWYDAHVLANGAPASLRRDFTLSAVVAGTAQLKVGMWGYIDWPTGGADHHVVVKLNGQVVNEGRFDGIKPYSVQVTVAAGVLRNGVNSLELLLPRDTGLEYDMVALDGFEVRYQRQTVAEAGAWSGQATTGSLPFAVSGLSAGPAIVWLGPTARLSTTVAGGQVNVPGGRAGMYWLAASSGINTPGIEAGIPVGAVTTQVDYLIITHPAFLDSLAPLEALQATRKLTTAVVTTEALYSRYTDHAVDASAISQYLAQTRPQFVLLVGGDVVDYHDNLKTGSVSFVPTRYVRTDEIVAYSPSDVKHVDWTGDNLPDAAIGRLPVRTVAELQAVIAKLYAYEQQQSKFTAVLATGKSDQDSIFTQEHRAMGEELGPQWQVTEAAMDLVGKTAARQLMLDAINGGVELVSYYGHSSYGLLDFDRLFTWQDVASLTNRGRPTVMTMWGCWNSYFVSAGIETLANRLLLTPEVGAVAVFGSATLTKSSSHKALASQLFSRFGGAETLGEAIMEAQQQVGTTNPAALDAILGMNLLGDPATPLFR